MNINSNLGSRTLVTLSVFCLALFLLSSIAAPSAFAKSTAGTNSGASDGVRGYSTSNAPSLASGACPSPIQKGAAKSIALGSGVEPTGVAYDPKNKNIYVTTTQGYFEVISTSTNKIVGGKISVDNSLGAIAVDSSSGQVFVASKTQSEVYVFNPVVAQGIALPTNSIPTYMIYDAFNGKVYVSDTFAKSISVIDTSSRAISNIALGGANPQPWGLAYDTYNGYVFVADRSDGTIQVINSATNTILKALAPNVANSGPVGVAFDPFNNFLYVTGQNTGDVFVYNVTGNTVSNYKQLRDVKLNAGSSPFGIGVDCSDGNVWIADSGSNQVELLSTCQSQIIGPPITTGISAPNWLSFDPVHHWMYVTNIGSDSIEAISADSRTANNAIDCPMGITDYGTNGATPTPYTTKEFVSTTTITALNIGTSSNAAFNGISSVQLNGVAYGIAEGTSAGGVYWIQDIVDFKQLGGGQFGLDAIDNIWNFQSLTSSVPNDLHFNQQNLCTKAVISPSNGVNFYYCQVDDVSTGKYFAKVSLPFTIKLNMTTYTATSGKYKGNSSVAFSYTISQNGIVKMSQEYDVVSFNAKVASSPLFHVGGFAPNKIPNDVENVFTGFASLAEVTIVKISATMQLQYLSGASLVEVPHAYGNGGETGETVQNVHMLPASGNTATVASGTDDSVQLW